MITILDRFWTASPATYCKGKSVRDFFHYYSARPKQLHTSANAASVEADTSELGQFVWRRLLPLAGTTPFPPHELMLMSAAVTWLRPKLIVEWGTNVGVSARIFSEVSRRYGIAAEIHSIDLPRSVHHHEHPGQRRGLLVRGRDVILHEGDGPTIAARLISAAQCARPLVFIDGDHARESVLRDAREVLCVAPTACLLFHDTFYQPSSEYNHGPHEAIRQIAGKLPGPCQIVEAGLGPPGMTLVVPG
jgi:cephalosporin hydroxylase